MAVVRSNRYIYDHNLLWIGTQLMGLMFYSILKIMVQLHWWWCSWSTTNNNNKVNLSHVISESWLRLPDDVRAVARHLLRPAGGWHLDQAKLRHDHVRHNLFHNYFTSGNHRCETYFMGPLTMTSRQINYFNYFILSRCFTKQAMISLQGMEEY